jgi:hypothetical protein
MVFATPSEMADAMCKIAIARPALNSLASHVEAAHAKLSYEAKLAAANLDYFIMNGRPALVIDLTRLNIANGSIRIMFWIAFAEKGISNRKIFILLPEPLWHEVKGLVSEKVVYTVSNDSRLVELEQGHRIDLREHGYVTHKVLDPRGSRVVKIPVHDNRAVEGLDWHPCQSAIKKLASHEFRAWKTASDFIFIVGAPSVSMRHIFASAAFIDVESPQFDEALVFLSIPQESDVTITWLAKSEAGKREATIELATLKRIRCNGLLRDGSITKQLGDFQIRETREKMIRDLETLHNFIRSCINAEGPALELAGTAR